MIIKFLISIFVLAGGMMSLDAAEVGESIKTATTPSSEVDKTQDARTARYNHLSKSLETLSDNELAILLKRGTPLHSGNGTSIKIEIDGIPIFVKLIPLNEIEGASETIRSTENLFKLPLYYQYGVGSEGFSVWREVSAHVMSTNWVLESENQNFPLTYHWRILKNSLDKKPLDEEGFKKNVAYWNDSSVIGQRIRANHDASTHVVLFVEYIPQTVRSWLSEQFAKGGDSFDEAIEMVEKNLLETTEFMNAKGMLHFDAHFKNILTDGKRLYFSDFGLATSSQFALSKEEEEFFHNHQNYDRCFVVTNLTHCILSNVFGKERVNEVVQEYAHGKTPLVVPETLTPRLTSIVKRYAPIALKMSQFFDVLINQTKNTPYPAEELEQLWINKDCVD